MPAILLQKVDEITPKTSAAPLISAHDAHFRTDKNWSPNIMYRAGLMKETLLCVNNGWIISLSLPLSVCQIPHGQQCCERIF